MMYAVRPPASGMAARNLSLSRGKLAAQMQSRDSRPSLGFVMLMMRLAAIGAFSEW